MDTRTMERVEHRKKSIRYIETVFVISMVLVLASAFGAIQVFTDYEGIILGVFLFIIAIPCYFLAKKGRVSYYINIAMNSIACGFVISGYFLVEKQTFDWTSILAAVASSIIMLISMEILYRMDSHPQIAFLLCWILNIGLIIGCITFWNQVGNSFCQYGFFLLIQVCFYLLILRKRETEQQELTKTIAFGSFGIFLVVLIAVLTILSDGDALDFLDFGIDNKKKNVAK